MKNEDLRHRLTIIREGRYKHAARIEWAIAAACFAVLVLINYL